MINNNRIILHCDINNFFASVECATKPELKNKPVAVSGNPAKRTGVILAKNEIAKSFGVSTGEAIWQAKAKCKDLVCLPPHMELYQEISEQIKVIYKQFTDKIEPFGIDECWLDVTDSAHLFGGGEKIAEKLRSMIKRTFNMTASVGISFCKLFAKIGSDLKKPDAQTLISRENFEELLYPMPACSIIGVGKSTQKTLAHLNINTLGELAKSDEKMLKSKLGIVGVMLKQKLLGNDFDEVTDISEEEEIKSIGNGTTTIKDIFTREEVEKTVYHLSEMIATRLRQHSFCAATVGVSIKNADLECFAHDTSMPFATSNSQDIAKCSMKLIDSFWKYSEAIRAIRIRTSSIKKDGRESQINLFDFENEKKANLDKGIDKIREKYGDRSVTLAALNNCDFINLKD